MIKSFKKSLFLARAARDHAATSSAKDAYQMLIRGKTTAKDDFESLWKVSSQFNTWKSVVNKHNCDLERLRELNRFLLLHGACVVVKGHYIPMSALAFPSTLDYLLEKVSDEMSDSQKIAVTDNIITYFADRRIGQIA